MLNFLKRLNEPSTIQGLSLIAGLAGYAIAPGFLEAITFVTGGAIAIVEIIKDDDRKLVKKVGE